MTRGSCLCAALTAHGTATAAPEPAAVGGLYFEGVGRPSVERETGLEPATLSLGRRRKPKK